MARGRGESDATSILYGGLDDLMPSARGLTRDLSQRGYNKDFDAWKKEEAAYIDSVISALEEATEEFAGSDDNWRRYLKIYSQNPTYTARNIIWADIQLAHKGVTTSGLVLSESAWRALGRRPKEKYAQPISRRDKKYGYSSDREWDDRYAAEMMRPLGFRGFNRELKDTNGRPILDADGNKVTEFVPIEAKGYKNFIAYHQDATEALDGGTAPPLPGTPWAEATGSDDDARDLLNALKDKVFEGEGYSMEFDTSLPADGEPASYRASDKTILVNPNASLPDQATGALRELFLAENAAHSKDDDDARKRNRAAAESAKFVIASLYGLDAEEQSFPHLAEIAEQKGGLKKLSSRIHDNVKTVLSYLDPKARAQARQNTEYQESRAAKRKAAQGKKKPSAVS